MLQFEREPVTSSTQFIAQNCIEDEVLSRKLSSRPKYYWYLDGS